MRHSLVAALVRASIQVALAQPRALSKLSACAILTTADVEGAAKGKQQTSQVGGGKGGVHCGYFLQLPSKAVEQYDFYVNEPTIVAELWKAFPKTKGKPLTGLWDEAYVRP